VKKGVIMGHKRRVARVIIWIAIVVFILIIPSFITMIYVFRHVKYLGVDDHVNRPLQNIYKAETFKIRSIEHTIKTSDGEVLWCAEVAEEEPKGVIIYLGAQKEPSVTYFYAHAAMMKEQGFASFLLDLRAHGKSTGKKLGLGMTEVEDVRALVNYIKSVEKYSKVPLIVQGVSLGGTVAINATALIPEIDGCIAMSPFASPEFQLDQILKANHCPGFVRSALKPFTHATFCLLYGKDKANNYNPLVQIQNVGDKPVLVMVAENDTVIPAENSYALNMEKASNAELWRRQTSDHLIVAGNDLTNVRNDKEYCTQLEGFIGKIVRYAENRKKGN